MEEHQTRPRIIVCIVLYKTFLVESESYRTMRNAAAELLSFDSEVEIFVADNSTAQSPIPQQFRGTYRHDGVNAGLARRYNEALEFARSRGAEWLLTLDQDTSLTADYCAEVLALTRQLKQDTGVAVLLPKLKAVGKLFSPHLSVYRRSRVALDEASEGVLKDTIYGFNSGAVLRVSAVQAIGGYDERYWLDYLDHATFAALQRRGGRIYVMRSVLQHNLAQAHGDVSPERSVNIERAEQMFYTEHVRGMDWAGRKLNLLRQLLGHGRRGRFGTAKAKFRLLIGRIP